MTGPTVAAELLLLGQPAAIAVEAHAGVDRQAAGRPRVVDEQADVVERGARRQAPLWSRSGCRLRVAVGSPKTTWFETPLL